MSDVKTLSVEMIATGEVKVVYAFFNFLWAITALIASYAIQALLTPKTDPQKPAALEDFDFPQFEEGTPQAVVFGDIWTEDQFILWYGNLRTSAIKSGGGKK